MLLTAMKTTMASLNDDNDDDENDEEDSHYVQLH